MAHSRHLPLYAAAYAFSKEIYGLKIKFNGGSLRIYC